MPTISKLCSMRNPLCIGVRESRIKLEGLEKKVEEAKEEEEEEDMRRKNGRKKKKKK